MDTLHSTVAARLNVAFEYAGITELCDQVEKIVEVCNVKIPTAKKYLSGQVNPTRSVRSAFNIIMIAQDLGVSGQWIIDGSGMSPRDQTFINWVRTLTDKQQNQTLRFAIRLLNKDAKVLRLIEMRDRGQISHFQLLEAM